jgi:uncharacterized phage protein (TIGR01671 family)
MREIKFRAWDEHSDGNGPSGMSYGVRHDCDATAIMQFTGLLDKNGKEIYEGDVIVWYVNDVTRKGIVEYHTASCSYDLKNFQDKWHVCVDWMRGEFEVIGNIYQDNHLLDNRQSL